MKKFFLTYCIIAAISSGVLFGCTLPQKNRTTAFYYGLPIPLDLLSRYEQVVVEPENIETTEHLDFLHKKGIKVYAYISIGEINRTRSWYSEIPKEWLVESHDAWGSDIVDLTEQGWHDYLINNYLASLWEKGYRGFFFDTLDSYQRAFIAPEQRLQQEKALAQLIKKIHQKFPDVNLMLNRGFEILPEVGSYVHALTAESLFQSWDQNKQIYQQVIESDRAWLLERLNEARKKYGMQIIVIDYVDPKEKKLARDVAHKIHRLGFTPWVTTPQLNTLGVSALEI